MRSCFAIKFTNLHFTSHNFNGRPSRSFFCLPFDTREKQIYSLKSLPWGRSLYFECLSQASDARPKGARHVQRQPGQMPARAVATLVKLPTHSFHQDFSPGSFGAQGQIHYFCFKGQVTPLPSQGNCSLLTHS